MAELSNGPGSAMLLAPLQQFQTPMQGVNPQIVMQVMMNAANSALVQVPPTPFELTVAVMESARCASRNNILGNILAARTVDMQVAASVMNRKVGWESVSLEKPAQLELGQAAAAPPV
jgi:hypothetical protein